MADARRPRPELTFVKRTVTWRFWALGWHRYSTRSRMSVLCIGLGPLRFHFIDWSRSRHV